ncbi:hypothetical protein CFAM422_008517 [Trichoderma lentiforme]|uniref:Heterokaryon incompatibility domain-containing protein n=1 Tax=Trichoderma lentiforme TaxID=1567552 RepID=A0A9P5C9Q1_9HYPO|nr:hypothetical protein CFAM422_008517 [Trichoderma lentiforme]
MADPEGKTILHINFGDITDQPLSLTGATPHRYRFLDGDALAHKSTIRVLEYEDLPSVPYAVISYVWRGLSARPDEQSLLPSIHVTGAEGADPISVDVLRLVALAAERHGCNLVWLDALCILQANEDDKAWQIQRMYDIYRSCQECIVAPGGLQRLVSLTEETSWASRAWTLQEAIAPPSVHCLFAWDRGDCYIQSNMFVEVKEIEKGVAAIAPLKSTLEMAMKGSGVSMHDRQGKKMELPSEDFKISIFGDMSRDRPRVRELIDAMDMKGKTGMFTAIWRSSFMRAAKYPVDTVFSVMGIMGVTLDTSKFKNEDRLGATIALMQGILARGEHAEWLAIATKTLPNPKLSTLPVFPQVDAARRPILETKDGMKAIGDVMDSGWRLANTPKGIMRDDGYFRFSALATSVKESNEGTTSASVFNSDTTGNWKFVSQGTGSHTAVLVGQWEQYNNGSFGMMINPWNQCLMILKEHAAGKFSNIGYAFVKEEAVQTGIWKESIFVVGGPN